MRIASPFPPGHTRCRLASTYLEPGQIAGLLDGDGSLTLLRRPSVGGVRIRPQIALLMRDDDPTPLAVWASVAAWRGRPMGSLFRSTTYRRHEWRVDRLDELVELTNWLARYPLLSPRGISRFAVIREATLILLASRIPGGGARRLPAADAARLFELRDRLPSRGAAVERLPRSPVADLVAPEHRGWVLSGLVAAEGTFALRSLRAKLAPNFSLVQRIDNVALLEAYRDELGVGRIRVRPGRGRTSPLATWSVTRNADCAVLAERLRGYPLPPSSPKAEQFDIWAAALHERGVATGGGRHHGASESSALRAAAAELHRLKAYRGPRLLCDCPAPWGQVD